MAMRRSRKRAWFWRPMEEPASMGMVTGLGLLVASVRWVTVSERLEVDATLICSSLNRSSSLGIGWTGRPMSLMPDAARILKADVCLRIGREGVMLEDARRRSVPIVDVQVQE